MIDLKSDMKTVTNVNNSNKPQVCLDHPKGIMLRNRGGQYFWTVSEEKQEYILKHKSAYIIVSHEHIPRHLIRTDFRIDKKANVMCLGCGKMFRKSQMDGALCRGEFGCSATAEVVKMRAEFHGYNTENARHTNEFYQTICQSFLR